MHLSVIDVFLSTNTPNFWLCVELRLAFEQKGSDQIELGTFKFDRSDRHKIVESHSKDRDSIL